MKKFIICAICAICGFTTASAQKFGHCDSEAVITAMPEFTTAQTDLQKLSQQYEAELKQMQEELQKKAEAFEKEEATLPDNIKQRRNQELQDLYQRIQEAYTSNQQALQKAQTEKMQAITAKVREAIQAIGQEGGYVYIMDLASGIPYISTTLSTDVTAQVKAKLGIK